MRREGSASAFYKGSHVIRVRRDVSDPAGALPCWMRIDPGGCKVGAEIPVAGGAGEDPFEHAAKPATVSGRKAKRDV
jgi:hypothetical protein